LVSPSVPVCRIFGHGYEQVTLRRQDLASAGIVMASRIIATSTKTLVTQFYHYIFPHFTFL
ncbi:hypothetical protein ACIXBO_23115, partial [Bacteroides fragilis]